MGGRAGSGVRCGAARCGRGPGRSPQPERGREVPVGEGGERRRDEAPRRPVERAGASGLLTGGGAVAAVERGEGLPAAAGGGLLDGQDLAEVGPAAVAGQPAGVPGPAGRTVLHTAYSR